jgi:hypothetical protein
VSGRPRTPPPQPLVDKEHLEYLTAQDRLRVRIVTQRGEPVEITVQLESDIAGRWEQVRRYDTDHGSLHMHHAPWDQETDRREPVAHGGLKHALDMAIGELKRDWEQLRAGCEVALAKGVRGGSKRASKEKP